LHRGNELRSPRGEGLYEALPGASGIPRRIDEGELKDDEKLIVGDSGERGGEDEGGGVDMTGGE
jgi:hypothetical protein